MNNFCCVEDEYTYYLRLYILGHEIFVAWKMDTHIIYSLYILGYEPFCRGR